MSKLEKNSIPDNPLFKKSLFTSENSPIHLNESPKALNRDIKQ